MASRSGTGIEMDLDRVPQREADMTPYELLLSESQERMLLVAEAGREQEVLDVFAKWDLDAALVGRVTNDGKMRVRWHGEIVVDIPVDPVAASSPVYERPARGRLAAPLLDLRVPSEAARRGASARLPNLCSRCGCTAVRPARAGATVLVPAATPASCASRAERGLASRPTATRATARRTRISARCTRWPRPRATWR
jgi:hypothetical protein